MLRQIIRVSKFWREYAGELAVEAIDDKVMREFIPWRRDYYANFKKLPKNAKLHPTDKTTSIGHDARQGHREMGSRAGPARQQACHNRNLHTEKEAGATSVRALGIPSALASSVQAYQNRQRQAHAKKQRATAPLCPGDCKFWTFGPGEANNLKLRDVHPFKDEKGRNNYRFIVRGKTGERDVIVRSVAAKRLDKFLTKRRAENPAGLLLVMPDGSQIITLIDQLDSALKEAGIQPAALAKNIRSTACVTFTL